MQTASCKDGTHGCGQANQIPWVNPKLADHQKSAWCLQWFRSGQRPTHTPQVSCRLPKCLAWSALCMSEKSQRDDKWLNPVRLQTPSCRMNMLSAYSYWAMCAYKLRWYHAKGEGRSLPIWLLNACVGDTGGQDSWFGTDLFTYASSFVQVTHFFWKAFFVVAVELSSVLCYWGALPWEQQDHQLSVPSQSTVAHGAGIHKQELLVNVLKWL